MLLSKGSVLALLAGAVAANKAANCPVADTSILANNGSSVGKEESVGGGK